MSKTGGGVGTNQYAVKGRSAAGEASQVDLQTRSQLEAQAAAAAATPTNCGWCGDPLHDEEPHNGTEHEYCVDERAEVEAASRRLDRLAVLECADTPDGEPVSYSEQYPVCVYGTR